MLNNIPWVVLSVRDSIFLVVIDRLAFLCDFAVDFLVTTGVDTSARLVIPVLLAASAARLDGLRSVRV